MKHIKFLWYSATKSIDERLTTLFLFNEVICKVGPVEQIMSDRGANFESNVFVHLCKLIGSKKVRSSAFHPAGNGGIEIVNKVIKPNLAKYVAESHDDWDICLGLAVNSYNNTLQSSIGMAPSEALFNRPPTLMADVICNNRLDRNTSIDNVSDYTLNLWRSAQRVRHVVDCNKASAQDKQKEMFDRFLKNSRTFEIGELVKIKSYKKKPGVCAAFQEKFSGPLKIVKKFSDVTFKLLGLDGKTETVHYNRLSPFYARNEVYGFGNEEAVLEVLPEVVDTNVFYSNLDNLTGVVFNYKAKLRRRAARQLLDDMNGPLLVLPLINLNINESLVGGHDVAVEDGENNVENRLGQSLASGSNESFNDAVGDALDDNLNNNPLEVLDGAENDEQLENVRRVGRAEWDELINLAAEVKLNVKGKRLALCWQFKGWFEAVHGIRVHKRACMLPMPLLITLTMEGDSIFNNIQANEEEIDAARNIEQAYFAQRPINSDVSSLSDPDPTLFDLDLEDLESNGSVGDGICDPNDETDFLLRNEVPSPETFSLNTGASPVV